MPVMSKLAAVPMVVVDNSVSAPPPPAGVAHFTPVACVESAVNTWLLVPTGRRATVLSAVAASRSPFASTRLTGTHADAPETPTSSHSNPAIPVPTGASVSIHNTPEGCGDGSPGCSKTVTAPAGPVAPALPVGPTGPIGPGGPVTDEFTPAGPGGPWGPVAPGAPVGPAGPVAPSAPGGPGTPCEPPP